MKISLNWLKKYVDINISNEDLVRLIGARLVEVEDVIDETHKYDNIFVVKVVECEPIPETHLHLCQIDAGDGLIQVVCGAPNVRKDMLAIWIAPGATVPASIHEDAPFVIGTREMRGYESNGMLAGADELDLGDDHSGIVEIDPEMAKAGDKFADVFELNDQILDIENKSLTHRPDCFGLIGFAREVAGILGQEFKTKEPCEFDNKIKNSVKISDKEICPRYSALVLEKHGEIKKKYLSINDTLLAKSGMRPIDPIVDATNYQMLLTGQPLHAFDYDKFISVGGTNEPIIGVRLAEDGEKLTLLDDTEVELNKTDIVITSNNIPVALAGAMGGKSTMIDENTKNIIIESATFSLYNLRKTQMAHGIFSEAITRFTKGQPAYQTIAVANECANMLSDGFKVSYAFDSGYKDNNETIKISTAEINGLLGTEYKDSEIIKTLQNVGFVVDGTKDLSIKAPEWRTDIYIKEDIIEEVGRLNGYDNIPVTLPMHKTASKNKMFNLKHKIRGIMQRFGAYEILSYSFVSEKLQQKAGQDPANSYKIVNSISPELQCVRQSLIPSLLDKAYTNTRTQITIFDKEVEGNLRTNFAIYEMNKVYQKSFGLNEENVPIEKSKIALVFSDTTKQQKTAYYVAKRYAEALLISLGINAEFIEIDKNTAEFKPFEKKRSAEIILKENPEITLGVVGEFKNAVKNNFKLGEKTAGFELDLDIISEYFEDLKELSIYRIKEPRDLSISTEKTYGEICNKISEILEKNNLETKNTILPVSIYQPEDAKYRNIAVRIAFFDKDTKEEIQAEDIKEIMSELEKIA